MADKSKQQPGDGGPRPITNPAASRAFEQPADVNIPPEQLAEESQPEEHPMAGAGFPHTFSDRQNAQNLPEDDKVQKATKAQILADSPAEEAKQKVVVVKESPRAHLTPSGQALEEAAGESDDAARGVKYAEAKRRARWG